MLLMLCGQAGAGTITDTITETIRGTISGGIDTGGVFGPVNANLTGEQVTVQLSYLLGTGPYVLAYSASDGGYVNPYGAITESISVGSKVFTAMGDNYQASGIMGVDPAGVPTGAAIGTSVGGYCQGTFYLLAQQTGQPECKDLATVGFGLTRLQATVLTQAGADSLFGSASGGSITINPYEVPYGSLSDPGAETFTWVTDPEPPTWFLAVLGLSGVGLKRYSVGSTNQETM
jgi:hypothetical protein